jgi:hypothetical protein
LTLIPADAADASVRQSISLVRDEIRVEQQEAKARIVDLHPVTIMQNALHSFGGDWSWVPPKANTIGPKEIVSARDRSFWLIVFRGQGAAAYTNQCSKDKYYASFHISAPPANPWDQDVAQVFDPVASP